VRRVRHCAESVKLTPLRAPCPGHGRWRLSRWHRIVPAHAGQRCRALHWPGRVRSALVRRADTRWQEQMMKFRSYVEPPEPIRGLEVPPGCGGTRWGQAAGGDHHDQRAFMEEQGAHHAGRYLLGLSNANRQAARCRDRQRGRGRGGNRYRPTCCGRARGLRPRPGRRSGPPGPPTTACSTAASGSTCSPSRARRSVRRAYGGSRRPWPCCGTGSRPGAAQPVPSLEAVTPDIFERITPAMAQDEHGEQHGSVRPGNPHTRARAARNPAGKCAPPPTSPLNT
jgi:hypothetical protein